MYFVICNFLKENNFTATNSDQNIFISINKNIFFAIYIGNLFLFGAIEEPLDIFKQELCFYFWISDLGDMFYYFKMEIHHNWKRGILIFIQTTYLKAV